MEHSHTPVDPGTIAAIRGGDLASLERVFRARFDDLVKEATVEPADAISAPHVVERAFTRIWADRGSIDSPQALESSLHHVVHDGVVRERSRRAAVSRLEKNVHAKVVADVATPSVDEAWERVSTAVNRPAHRGDGGEQAAHARHATAEHVHQMGAKRAIDWRVVGGAVVLVGAVLGLFTLLGRGAADEVVMQMINAPDARKIETRPAQRASATLRDGSTAALGAESRIKVPFTFPRDTRAVGLEGTATFTVVPAAGHVFDVRAKNVSVTSHSGVFTVRSYADDSTVAVRAKEGEVIVATPKGSQPLAAGSAVSIASDGSITPLAVPAADEALGWADGRLIVANRPLRAVIPEFKRWYLLDLYTKDAALQDRVVDSLSADLESSRTAVAALEKAAGVKLTFEGKTMVLQDARTGRGARR